MKELPFKALLNFIHSITSRHDKFVYSAIVRLNYLNGIYDVDYKYDLEHYFIKNEIGYLSEDLLSYTSMESFPVGDNGNGEYIFEHDAITFRFEDSISKELEVLIDKSIDDIKIEFFKRYGNKEYKVFFNACLYEYQCVLNNETIKKYPFLMEKIKKIEHLLFRQSTIIYSGLKCFNLLATSEQIITLVKYLIKEGFINNKDGESLVSLFSGTAPQEKIIWLPSTKATGKKSPNKSALLSVIDTLKEIKILTGADYSNRKEVIESNFRDLQGLLFQNLGVSIANYTMSNDFKTNHKTNILEIFC